MKKDVRVYLEDIWESIKKIEEYTKGVTERFFFENTQLQDAVVRRMEIIGEAVKNLPNSFKSIHPDVPWKQIAGMRDVLIHEYAAIDFVRVWRAIEKDIPEFKKHMRGILREVK